MGLIKSIRRRQRRKREQRERIELFRNAIRSLGMPLKVHHGPFKGMLYPSTKSAGSELYPKLLGSYERELHQTIEIILSEDYSEIVDIGCAEGYYAVGLAMHFLQADIYAYDVDEEAASMARAMAELNSIEPERFHIGSYCSTETLISLPYRRRALIFCDCEGCEKSLFQPDTPAKLALHDLLVETHDVIDIEISTYLESIFEETHSIERILSVHDIQKAKYYNYPELESYDLDKQRILLSEQRGATMEWLYLRSKKR